MIRALLLLAGAVLLGAAGESFPVPRESNQVFYVQRSLNSNTIVYTARLGEDGKLDPRRPVDVFWRRFNDAGERKELSMLERGLAFGVRSEPVKDPPDSFTIRVVSYPKRSALLRIVDGMPRLEMKIAGVAAKLDHAYLEVDEIGSLPSVTRVDLYGISLADGTPLKESFKPW